MESLKDFAYFYHTSNENGDTYGLHFGTGFFVALAVIWGISFLRQLYRKNAI